MKKILFICASSITYCSASFGQIKSGSTEESPLPKLQNIVYVGSNGGDTMSCRSYNWKETLDRYTYFVTLLVCPYKKTTYLEVFKVKGHVKKRVQYIPWISYVAPDATEPSIVKNGQSIGLQYKSQGTLVTVPFDL